MAKDLRIPIRVEGNVEGLLTGTFFAEQAANERRAALHLDLKATTLRVQDIPAERLHGDLEDRKGSLDYKLEGQTLGGTFDLEGQFPGKDEPIPPKKEEAKKGQLKVQGVRLERLLKALHVRSVEPLTGAINLEVAYTHETPDRFPEGRGTLRITNVRWKDALLADNLHGAVVLSGEQLRLRDMGGAIAGRLRAEATYVLRRPQRGSFSVGLDDVESAQLLGPWLPGKVEGPLQARVRGSLGSEWRGSADVEVAHGKLYGIDISQWRIPATWSFAPGQDRGRFDVMKSAAAWRTGRRWARRACRGTPPRRVEGNLRVFGVDLQDLRQVVGAAQFGAGQTNARLDFSGNDVRSLSDLSGKLTASFKQAQALQVPILSQTAPFLGMGASTTFQKGNLVARLDRGVLRIQQLGLQGNTKQALPTARSRSTAALISR